MVGAYKLMFRVAPKQNIQSPLEKSDHPELDESPLLDEDGIRKYQSLIGTLQWTISLGRFDIAMAVMTMSSFQWHLEKGTWKGSDLFAGTWSSSRVHVSK
jgi:hypothetical protein